MNAILDTWIISVQRSPIARRPFARECWRELWFLIVGCLVGLTGSMIVVSTVSIAFGLAVVVIGLPLAVLAAYIDRWWCGIERARAARLLGRPVIAEYQPRAGDTRIARWLSVLKDRQTWLDALWMLFGGPLSFLTCLTALCAWVSVGGLLSAPTWFWAMPGWIGRNALGFSILAPMLAFPAAIATAWIIHALSLAQAGAAARVLGIPRNAMLEARMQTLTETRAGAVEAAVTELQRVERDLHDGAQARLVALAMDLGMAEQRLAQADPAAAAEHVANAQSQARAAMAELRDLVRGIGPSILTDRGLDAALTALVAGREPPVALRVQIPQREVDAAQTALYFVVAEALTNARKHAKATRISVDVWQDAANHMLAEIVDDGVGGADAMAGSGLQGMYKRVAALDGTLTVTSPSGGPTRIRAELPCAS